MVSNLTVSNPTVNSPTVSHHLTLTVNSHTANLLPILTDNSLTTLTVAISNNLLLRTITWTVLFSLWIDSGGQMYYSGPRPQQGNTYPGTQSYNPYRRWLLMCLCFIGWVTNIDMRSIYGGDVNDQNLGVILVVREFSSRSVAIRLAKISYNYVWFSWLKSSW